MFNQISSKIFGLMPRMYLASKTSSKNLFSSPPIFVTVNCIPQLHSGESTTQVRYRSNRSRRGLYDGKDVRTGNNVSFSMRHTKRKFRPNVFIKRVYSEVLDAMVPFHLTTSALRSIDKAGGLDNYLLKNDITEGEGHKIKKNILKRLKNQAYFANKSSDSVRSIGITDEPTISEATKTEKIEV